MAAVVQTMVDEKIGPGQRRKDFNNKFLEVSGFSGSITSVRTIIDAIIICLNIAGLQPGDGVIISALSPSYYKKALKIANLKPIIVDVSEDNAILSYEAASEYFEKAKIILMHEPSGNIILDDSFQDCPLPIIEDISESFLSNLYERKAGSIGSYIIYALEEESLVSSAGGALVISKKSSDSKALRDQSSDEIALCDLNAALAYIQVSSINLQLERRMGFYKKFYEALNKTNHKLLGINSLEYQNVSSGFCILTNKKCDDVMNFAKAKKIKTEKKFKNVVIDFSLPSSDKYKVAKSFYYRSVNFPLYPFLHKEEVDLLYKVISNLP